MGKQCPNCDKYVVLSQHVCSPVSKRIEWKPWETYKEEPELLKIDAPPCPDCKFWKPQRIYTSLSTGTHYDGVRLCHVDGMHDDFSCYKNRDN